MKKKLYYGCLSVSILSFIGLVIITINAMNEPMAYDIISAVVVQIALAAIFIASFVGFVLTLED
ncbi:hypothetical protein KHQ89_04655 [Mycoplasmatota bacterium]|nr:hypothetical protein KHQ89_04655 [Mycoplasmatota bacterium]